MDRLPLGAHQRSAPRTAGPSPIREHIPEIAREIPRLGPAHLPLATDYPIIIRRSKEAVFRQDAEQSFHESAVADLHSQPPHKVVSRNSIIELRLPPKPLEGLENIGRAHAIQPRQHFVIAV